MKRNAQSKIKTSDKVRIILTLFMLAAVAVGAYLFVSSCKLENTVIKYDADHYTVEELKEFYITEKTDNYAPLLYLRMKFMGVPEVPFVEQADFVLTDRNSIEITVYGKVVIGCVEQMEKYMHFDREGIVVECTDEPVKGSPVIKGLSFDSVIMNQKLELSDHDMYDSLLDLSMLLYKHDLDATSIEFDLRGMVILTVKGNEILLGRRDNYDLQINNLPGILSALSEGEYTVDMRNYSEENREVYARLIR